MFQHSPSLGAELPVTVLEGSVVLMGQDTRAELFAKLHGVGRLPKLPQFPAVRRQRQCGRFVRVQRVALPI